MGESIEQLIGMAHAAAQDERLSDGALYRKLARALALQNSVLDKLIIVLRNQDQSEYEAKMLGFAKQILRADINWTEDTPSPVSPADQTTTENKGQSQS